MRIHVRGRLVVFIMPIAKRSSFKQWLLGGAAEIEGPHEQEGRHPQHAWWKVMCLTGVD